jgi:Na+-translocating ferredoxin:NAD+ oxidoreductase RnfG subunit
MKALALAFLLAAPLLATDYLTPDQAARGMFPQAERFDAVTLADFRGRVLVARKGEQPQGFVVIDNVLGKSERITMAVGVGLDGRVVRVEILSYRESHGQEVRLPAWRRQFEGKTSAAPLRVGKDIAGISGATLSCNSVTEGVRQAVTLVEGARHRGELR